MNKHIHASNTKTAKAELLVYLLHDPVRLFVLFQAGRRGNITKAITLPLLHCQTYFGCNSFS